MTDLIVRVRSMRCGLPSASRLDFAHATSSSQFTSRIPMGLHLDLHVSRGVRSCQPHEISHFMGTTFSELSMHSLCAEQLGGF